MSSETATPEPPSDADVESANDASLMATVGRLHEDIDRQCVISAGAAAAFAVVALQTLLRILHNLPYDPVAVPPGVRAALAVGTPVVLAIATIATALVARRSAPRVGLLFVGVFGPLAVLSPAATLPAVVGVTAGGVVALIGSLGRPSSYPQARRAVVGAAFAAGVAVSLASSVGILSGSARGFGAALTLAALAVVGLLIEGDRAGLAAGALTFLGVAVAAGSSPFVAGSVLLVGFSVVGVPHALVALAAGGGVAALVAGIRQREAALVAGVGLLLLAGVPVTLPRAMAVLLGATVVLVGPERLTARSENSEVEP